MARQKNMKFTGRRGNIVFYEFRGEYYIRTKSTLQGKRVKKDPAFKKTMENASIFGTASKIAMEVYRQLPSSKKKNRIDLKITSRSVVLLRSLGLSPDEAREILIKEYLR